MLDGFKLSFARFFILPNCRPSYFFLVIPNFRTEVKVISTFFAKGIILIRDFFERTTIIDPQRAEICTVSTKSLYKERF